MTIIVAKVMNEKIALFFHLGLPKFLFRHSLLIRKSDIIQQDELRIRDTGLYTVQNDIVRYLLLFCSEKNSNSKISIVDARLLFLIILKDIRTKIEEIIYLKA